MHWNTCTILMAVWCCPYRSSKLNQFTMLHTAIRLLFIKVEVVSSGFILVLCNTSILIVDTYATVPVSQRSRYTAVYRSSTKYRETTQVSRVSSRVVPYSIIYIHLFKPTLHETILRVIVSYFLSVSVQSYWSCYWDRPTVKHVCMNTRLLRLLSVCKCKSSQHATCYRSLTCHTWMRRHKLQWQVRVPYWNTGSSLFS